MSPEEAIPRAEFARRLGVHVRTLDRWCKRGLCGVRLPSVRVGTRPRFRLQDFSWWQEQLEKRLLPPAAPPKGPTARQREKAEREAERVLRRHGVRLPGDDA